MGITGRKNWAINLVGVKAGGSYQVFQDALCLLAPNGYR